MTWETLNRATEKYIEKQKLQRIAAIVANHPEWQQDEPELGELLKQVKVDASTVEKV